MTFQQIITKYSKQLIKFDSPILDVELLLCHVLKKSKEYLLTYPDQIITNNQLRKFQLLFKRRLKGEPIAYLLGHKEFYDLNFIVNKNVLIPRPETEILVDEALKFIKNMLIIGDNTLIIRNNLSIIDIGTGSGCIAISIAQALKSPPHEGGESEGVKIVATDTSAQALKIAKLNATLNKVKIKFIRGNLLSPFSNQQSTINNSKFRIQNSVIIGNLPYLTQSEMKEPSIQFEPKSALSGGPDGLKYFREFFSQIKKYQLKPQAIFLEIGFTQAAAIKKLAKSALPNYNFEVKKDLCGKDRLVIITIR